MNNLVFNKIAIISMASKTAKIQEFTKGINVVTSSKQAKGNWVGKSSLLKSLYHSLGADSLFDDSWGTEGEYAYVLSFSFKDQNYNIFRFGKLFKLYDSNNKVLFTVANREDLATKLSSIFGINIKLKDQSTNKQYKDALPVYWYLFNFSDQTDSKPCEFRSFKNLGSSSNFYSDLIYSHLGLRSNELNDLLCDIDELNQDKSNREQEKKTLDEVYKILKEKSTPVVDQKLIKQSLQKYEKEYSCALDDLNKVHSSLEKAYTEKAELEALLNHIDALIQKQRIDIKDFEIKQECPHCGSTFNDNKIYYFRRVKDIDGFGMQRIDVEEKLALCKRKINLEMEKYNSLKEIVDNIQKKIDSDGSINKNDISNIGLSNTIKDVLLKQKFVEEVISSDDEKIKSKTKIVRELKKDRKAIDEHYCIQLSEKTAKYSIPGFSINTVKSADEKFNVSGTVNNVAKMIWLSALLQTRYDKNQSFPVLPLVVDTPNNADYDEENSNKIFDIVFSMKKDDNQIITSLVGFDKKQFPDYANINVIYLNNEQRHLLNEQDFLSAKQDYLFLGIFDN